MKEKLIEVVKRNYGREVKEKKNRKERSFETIYVNSKIKDI